MLVVRLFWCVPVFALMKCDRWCSHLESKPAGVYSAVTCDLVSRTCSAGGPIVTAQLCTSCFVDIMYAGMHHL